jgi:hypothetical protein
MKEQNFKQYFNKFDKIEKYIQIKYTYLDFCFLNPLYKDLTRLILKNF